MTDRQGLVPDNLPYGERQNAVAAMDQAGVSLSPTPATGGAASGGGASPTGRASLGPPPTGAPASGLDLLRNHAPDEFAFLSDPDGQQPEAQPAAEPDSVVSALAQSAQSSFGAAVLSRLTSTTRR